MQKVIFLLFFLSITYSAVAQFEFGVKGGYSPYIIVSNSFEEETSYTAKQTAWAAAVYFSEDILDKLRIRIQVDYTAHYFAVDSKWSGPNNWNQFYSDCSVGYINLYFVPQYLLGSKKRTYLFCGKYAGRLVNATMNGTAHYNYGGTIGTDTVSGNAKDSFTENDFGLTFGGGYRYPLTDSFGLIGEASSGIGLIGLAHAWDSGFFNFLNFRFEIGLSYRINRNGPSTDRSTSMHP